MNERRQKAKKLKHLGARLRTNSRRFSGEMRGEGRKNKIIPYYNEKFAKQFWTPDTFIYQKNSNTYAVIKRLK